jgi:hypothetical protein
MIITTLQRKAPFPSTAHRCAQSHTTQPHQLWFGCGVTWPPMAARTTRARRAVHTLTDAPLLDRLRSRVFDAARPGFSRRRRSAAYCRQSHLSLHCIVPWYLPGAALAQGGAPGVKWRPPGPWRCTWTSRAHLAHSQMMTQKGRCRPRVRPNDPELNKAPLHTF